MISENSKRTIEALEEGKYVNSREIALGGVPFTARDVLLKAPLISRLNYYCVGGTGRGKTQLGNDLIGVFGDLSCYALGRPDFEPSELLKQLNLKRLKEGVQTDRELVELTENVRKSLFLVDEINRAPPIIQNYFFDFGDGKIVHDGKIINLGNTGYSILLATGNLGDGEYVGVSEMDRALKDRMHMIVKLDHPDFRPTPLNMVDIFRGKKNPRADMPHQHKANAQDIFNLNKEFMDREIHPVLPFLGVYLTEGLDWLENVKGHSKIACDTRWPNLEGIRHDNDEDKIFPISPRGVFASMGLAGALQMIAESRGVNPNQIELFLDSFKLTIPYSGVLSPAFVDQMHGGDVYSAFNAVLGKDSATRREISESSKKLEEAVVLAELGEKPKSSFLDEICPLSNGRWKPVREAIESYADRNAKNPEAIDKNLKDVIQKAHRGI